MSRIRIEGEELNFNEMREITGQKFFIKDNRFEMRVEEQVSFSSDIYQFQDDSLIYLKKDESASGGMIDVVFNYMGLQDFDLIKVNLQNDVDVRRVELKKFVITSINQEGGYGDVKFCRVNDQKKLEEATISFTKLNNIIFLDNYVVLSYFEAIEKDQINKKLANIAIFDFDGKQKRSIIDKEVDFNLDYFCEIKNGFLLIILNKKNKKKVINKIKIENLG